MTVKDFCEKTTGVDEYIIEGRETCSIFRSNEKEKIIKRYGERKIISIYFYVDDYEDKGVEITIE